MTEMIYSWISRSWGLVSLMLLLVVLAVIAPEISGSAERTMTVGLINLILVVGLYVFIGNSGVVSFGHVSFMAIGAYVAGLLTIPAIAKPVIIPNMPDFILNNTLGTIEATLLAGGVAALFGLIVGIPLARLTGLAAGIGMFAVLLIVNNVFTHFEPSPSGSGSLTRVPTDTTLYSALVWALVALAAAYIFQTSRVGLLLRATREDAVAATAIGINVARYRLAAMVVSAFITGVGGALFAHYVGTFGADAFFLQVTFLTLAMLVIGGVNSLSGVVVGTVVITVISHVLDRWVNGDSIAGVTIGLPPGAREITVALIMVAILILRPQGLTGGREIEWPFNRKHRVGKSNATAKPSGTVAKFIGDVKDRIHGHRERNP
jgi:branched-chain amino acid transport system permease protein